jgi:hypothetical protein
MLDVRGFFDTDLARDIDHGRSTSGYMFNLFGGEINWMNKRHAIISLSTKKVEYMVATHASKEAI